MATGKKTGGRAKGTKNKSTQAVEAAMKVAAAGLTGTYTGLEFMQAIYRNENAPAAARMAAAKEAMPYESPKLSSVEHSGPNGKPIPVGVSVRFVSAPTTARG